MATFGQTTKGSLTYYDTCLFATKFAIAEAGYVTSISLAVVQTASVTSHLKLALYDSSGTLLSATEEGTVTGAYDDFVTLNLLTPQNISAGTYILANMSDSSNLRMYYHSDGYSGQQGYISYTYADGIPSLGWFSFNYANYYDIYATYTPVSTYTLSCASGARSLTGTATGLKAGRKLSSASGAMALSGSSVSLSKTSTYSLMATSGAMVLSGTSTNPKVGRKLSSTTGNLALTGQSVGLSKTGARTLSAASGTIALSGSATGLRLSRKLAPASGALALTGSPINVGTYKSFGLQSDGTSIFYDGVDHKERYATKFEMAETGVVNEIFLRTTHPSGTNNYRYALYTIDGTLLSQTEIGTVTGYFDGWLGLKLLTPQHLAAGTYLLAHMCDVGSDCGNHYNADGYSGQQGYYNNDVVFEDGFPNNATFWFSYANRYCIFATYTPHPSLSISSGEAKMTGSSIDLRRATNLPIDAASMSITGTVANLNKGRRIVLSNSLYDLAGSSIDLMSARKINVKVGARQWNGANINMIVASGVYIPSIDRTLVIEAQSRTLTIE